jgi:hypothetical protein
MRGRNFPARTSSSRRETNVRGLRRDCSNLGRELRDDAGRERVGHVHRL